MGPHDSCSFHLTQVIALVSRAGGLPVRLRYLRRARFPELASARSRGRLASVPLVFRLAGVRPGRCILCCGVDSHDSDDKKTSTKEESDHGASACVSPSGPSRRSRHRSADLVSGSGDGSGLRSLLDCYPFALGSLPVHNPGMHPLSSRCSLHSSVPVGQSVWPAVAARMA